MEKTETQICITTIPSFTMLCLKPSHNWLPKPDIFCFYLEMVFKVMAWAISGSYSVFLGISVYAGDMHVTKSLLIFLLLMSLFIMEVGEFCCMCSWFLSSPRRDIKRASEQEWDERKYISLWTREPITKREEGRERQVVPWIAILRDFYQDAAGDVSSIMACRCRVVLAPVLSHSILLHVSHVSLAC